MLTKGERWFRRGLHMTIGLLVAFTAFVVVLEPKQGVVVLEPKQGEASAAPTAAPTPPLCSSK